MKLLQQNPTPPLLTGHSPPSQQQTQATRPIPAVTPRFQGLPENSISQFITDTLGVWAPKVPLTRSKTQFFEDAFLELVEDGAFYFALPVVGPILGNAVAKRLTTLETPENQADLKRLAKALKIKADKNGVIDTRQLVGQTMQDIAKQAKALKIDQSVLKPLIATKAGALIGTVAIAGGLEYMIQHTKNVITAKGFKTKNFAAVAGLESGSSQAQAGEMDPVVKAKKRAKQVGALVLGGLGLTVLAPKLVLKNAKAAAKAENVLKVVDFDKGFDISKPVLAALISAGAASYIDASRDSLERKETITRLAVVVPFLLFGKEMAGYGLAKLLQRSKVEVGGVKKPINSIINFTEDINPLKKMRQKDTLLQFNVIKKSLAEELENLAKKDTSITPQVKADIIAKHGSLGVWSYLISALVCGTGINWIAYQQTKNRYQDAQQAPNQAPQTVPPVGTSFGGRQTGYGYQSAQPAWAARPSAQPWTNANPFTTPLPNKTAFQA